MSVCRGKAAATHVSSQFKHAFSQHDLLFIIGVILVRPATRSSSKISLLQAELYPHFNAVQQHRFLLSISLHFPHLRLLSLDSFALGIRCVYPSLPIRLYYLKDTPLSGVWSCLRCCRATRFVARFKLFMSICWRVSWILRRKPRMGE